MLLALGAHLEKINTVFSLYVDLEILLHQPHRIYNEHKSDNLIHRCLFFEKFIFKLTPADPNFKSSLPNPPKGYLRKGSMVIF